MASLVDTVASPASVDKRYVVIPMSRLLSNDAVLANNSLALAAGRADLTPTAPEEPQVGFRFDTDASYQVEMRYGRRSKLELLWRLGAIAYERALHIRTWPWEASDKLYLTSESYASVRPSEEDKSTLVTQENETVWVRAGWVYRLFGGDKSQEEEGREAGARRNVNRIKGLVSFIERLDEKVARGLRGDQGFRQDRLWTWDGAVVDRLGEMSRKGKGHVSRERVENFEGEAAEVLDRVLATRDNWSDDRPETVAMRAGVLAMAGHLTRNATYSLAAARYVKHRFIEPFTPDVWTASEAPPVHDGQHSAPDAATDEDSIGYVFPLPTTGELPMWVTNQGMPSDSSRDLRSASDWGAQLPYDPLEFDPSILLDTFRLLSRPWLLKQRSEVIPKWRVHALASAHLAHLLLDPAALELSRQPPTLEDGAMYDLKVAALASFLDDARLLGRVATRAPLRVDEDFVAEDGKKMTRPRAHDWLAKGLANVKLRPWDSDPSSYWASKRQRGRPLKEFESLGL
jgi:hypothetical protein